MIELYKDLIIDHGSNPRNNYVMKKYTHYSKGFNHFCGDYFSIYLNIIDNCIKDISFDGKGCSISVASSSLMTLYLKNKNIDDVYFIFDYFNNLIKNNIEENNNFLDLNVLANVRKFPSRVKCATLIWHILFDALKK